MDISRRKLISMMRPYEGRYHSVVAFELQNGEASFVSRGAEVSDVPPEDWIFEIASITKVFAAILMCLLVEEGKIDPKAPLRDMSDRMEHVPDWITPERLASHTSGLPNYYMPLWKAFLASTPDGPYATFSRSDLLDWLRNWRGPSLSGRHNHRYSNLGFGLLGEAMAMMEGKPFIDLLTDQVTDPLGLTDTTVSLDEGQTIRFAQPRKPNGTPTQPWTFESLAGAGCLRSSARDLARFAGQVLRALDAPETPLDRAICRSARTILGLGTRGALTPMAQCAGWLRITMDPAAPSQLFHNGGTAGSTCALHICPDTDAAFGILSNNGIAGNLWASTKLQWTKPFRTAHQYFMQNAGAASAT